MLIFTPDKQIQYNATKPRHTVSQMKGGDNNTKDQILWKQTLFKSIRILYTNLRGRSWWNCVGEEVKGTSFECDGFELFSEESE